MTNRDNYILEKIHWFAAGTVGVAIMIGLVMLAAGVSFYGRACSLFLLGIFGFFMYYGYRNIYQPLQMNNKIKARFAKGDSYEDIYNMAYPMSEEEITDYIEHENVMDKAGAYGIQGRFAIHIDKIEGDYYNVVGLPISYIYEVLKKEVED